MEVRNRPGKKQRARVIPVILRLDGFRAGRSDKLAEIEFEALGLWRLQAEKRLIDVVTLIVRTTVDQSVGAAKEHVDMCAHRIGIVIQDQHGLTQVELVGLVVKVVKVVRLSVCGGGRTVSVVAVVAVDHATDVHRSNTPRGGGRSSGS